MTEKVYLETRERLRDEQARLQEELEKVAGQIRALDLVWTQVFAGASDGGAHAGDGDDGDDSNSFNRKVVEWAVGTMGDRVFSVREIEAEIARKHPHITLSRNNIAMKLKRLSEANIPLIEQVEAGIGRRPSTYRRN
jgi:hypothetical protein